MSSGIRDGFDPTVANEAKRCGHHCLVLKHSVAGPIRHVSSFMDYFATVGSNPSLIPDDMGLRGSIHFRSKAKITYR